MHTNGDVTEDVIGAAFEAANVIGAGFLETVQNDLDL